MTVAILKLLTLKLVTFELRGSLGIPRPAPSAKFFSVLSEPRTSKLRLIVLLSNRMTSGIHAHSNIANLLYFLFFFISVKFRHGLCHVFRLWIFLYPILYYGLCLYQDLLRCPGARPASDQQARIWKKDI